MAVEPVPGTGLEAVATAEFTSVVRQARLTPTCQPLGALSERKPFEGPDLPRQIIGPDGQQWLSASDHDNLAATRPCHAPSTHPSGVIEACAGSENAANGGSGATDRLLASSGVGHAAVSEPSAAVHVLLKAQAAAAAVAFNVAYEEENDTPSYDRLPVAPLRLGSRLAASALPVSTAPPPLATPPQCGSLVTHGSLTAASSLLEADGPAALPHRAGSDFVRVGKGQGGGRPQKRRRLDGDDAAGGGAAGGIFTLPPEFAFVLNRCFNCGSYGHDLRICKRPRNQTNISTRQREWSESRGAMAAERRMAKQVAVAAQRRGPRHKASHGRYFSTAAPGEEEADAAQPDATGAEATPADVYDPTQALTQAPAGVRPGALSIALAAALGLKCPLDPPPWLVGMALHGIPPAYCRGPYLPLAAEAEPEAPVEQSAAEAVPPPAAASASGAHIVDWAEGSAREMVVAGTAMGGEPDWEPLLPDAPCHVPYAGLNAPVVEAACRQRWRVALGGARRVAALMEAARGAMLRREQRLQQQPQQQGGQGALCEQGPRPEGLGQPTCRGGQLPQPLLQPQHLAEGLGGQWRQQQQQHQQGAMMTAMGWPLQQQQQPCWQQQLMWRQQQLQMQQQCQFIQQQQQLRQQQQMQRPQQQQGWPVPQGIPFFFGGPNFQGHGGQGPAFPGFR
ncbi:hypothetical protein PLESTB_000741300 [Pleodorina starrii]|uniref:CCHC-type domain-containing protein n=1 Tax=Pleodorina starrii TaxID=330485 RepID=A0A9W6BJR1_9CHLO|nr:hypothetical protein PLESTM_000183500 [Pleodorina starrii]GLC53404.1 hypothetical protein PLESTB_000741300 [Pleodorina starrii]GLC69729.1 hypothetical protein PLESTF_000873500 [Pleodorina starrii]